MRDEHGGVDRRKFLKTGLQATAGAVVLGSGVAGAVALGSGVAGAAVPDKKEIKLKGPLPTKPFGKTGHELPILAFGGCGVVEQWGARGYNAPVLPVEERVSLIRYAYDQGIRYFDTARQYFESEEIYGAGLKGIREDIYLATKIWAFRPEEVRESVETSLATLGTDYVDAMQIHGPIIERLEVSACMKLQEEMVKLRDEGLFRFIGLTNHVAFEKTHEMICTGGFDQVMLAHGYFKGNHQLLSDRNVEWREMCLAEAHDREMGVVLMKMFGGWIYNKNAERIVPGYDPEGLKKLPAAAIRWALGEDRFNMYNLGFSYREHVDASVETFSGDATPTADDRRLLADYTGKAYESPRVRAMKVV